MKFVPLTYYTVQNVCIQYLIYINLNKVVFCSCSIQEIIIVICIHCFFVGIFFSSNLFIYLQQPLRRLCALHFGIAGNINSLKQSCFLVWRHTIMSTLPCIHVIVIQLSAASVRHETRILLAASRVRPVKFHLTWDRLHVLLGCTIDDAPLIHSDANRNSHYTCMANGQLEYTTSLTSSSALRLPACCYICVYTWLLHGFSWGPRPSHPNRVRIKSFQTLSIFLALFSDSQYTQYKKGAHRTPPQITATYFQKSM